ncbi:MAG TPA: hypothetical protein VH120_07280 [Gemmataceae bacterium]|nr:hypothetical protein [Gemmataceae bacterium]
MKEYELYLPLTYNDGSPVEDAKIERVGEQLQEEFGGVTFFPQPNQGRWLMGGVTFRDQIVIFRVRTGRVRTARRYFKKLIRDLKSELNQEEILVVEKDAERL